MSGLFCVIAFRTRDCSHTLTSLKTKRKSFLLKFRRNRDQATWKPLLRKRTSLLVGFPLAWSRSWQSLMQLLRQKIHEETGMIRMLSSFG